jgi:ribosome maturation factor RimP
MKVDEKLREEVAQAVTRHGAYVIDVVLRGDHRRPVLEVFIDAEKPVTIEQCTQISRDLSALIEGARMLASTYRLEVSSPGIDRPLQHAWQYPKHVGRKIQVTARRPEGTLKLVGMLTAADAGGVTVAAGPNEEPVRVAFADIREALVLPPW